MNLISKKVKEGFHSTVHFLNRPLMKEGIKNIAGTVTFAFGLLAVYDLYRTLKSKKKRQSKKNWRQTALKVVTVCAQLSLILSAGVSRPGVYLISSLVGLLFSDAQLCKVFGPNTRFAVNPWHPRHVVSIVAVLLALPSVIQSICHGIKWATRKIRKQSMKQKVTVDNKIRCMALFNTLTSRPALHLGNMLARV